jgi:hypothetical protein
MKEVAESLIELIKKVKPLLLEISEKDSAIKPKPDKWSKKEIIGHLIDSASNNHQKFIRTIEKDGHVFPPYQQDFWVNIQHYQSASWDQLINFWELYNIHLAQIIANTETKNLKNKIVIGSSAPFELGFIMSDYVEHLKHHLKQILPGVDFLESKFKMVY